MERLKYIVSKSSSFVIFSESETHSDIAKGMHKEPAGAGFCSIAVGYKEEKGKEIPNINVHCFGESISLRISSREEDEKIINRKLNNDL